MIRFALAFIALIWTAALGQAAYFHAATYLPPACPYPATQAVDGCAGAPVANALTIQHSNFFSGYAQQTSQSWPATAGNTGPGNPGLQAPHPAYNVAGVDYPVGPANGSSKTPGSDSYDRNPDVSHPGYGLKLLTQNNFTLDGFYSLSNGCNLNAGTGRLNCLGTAPNNAKCPTIGRGNNCIIFDGYDFTNHTTIGSVASDGSWMLSNISATQFIIKNSYLAPSTLSYSQVGLYTFSGNYTVTLSNNLIDSKNDLTNLVAGTGWGSFNSNMNTFFSFSPTNNTLTDNTDCGAYSAAYCIKYNAFINSVSRMLAFTHTNCTGSPSPCDGFVSQFNYHEMGNNVQWKFTGWIDDGSVPGGYSGIAGKCFVVQAQQGGVTLSTASMSTAWQLLTAYSNAGTPAFNTKATVYSPTTTACNNTGSPLGVSFNMNVNAAVAVPPGTQFYMNNGIHGDPYFVAFNVTGSIPTTTQQAGQWLTQYNATLFPKSGWSSTGMSTQNTTVKPIVKAATLNNCTPNCATGAAGNTLNVTSLTTGIFPLTTLWPTLTFSSGSTTVTLGTGNLPSGAVVRLSCTAVPTGFSANTDYFVVSPGAGTVQLSATSGGAAITPTSTGTSCRVQGNITVGMLIPGSDASLAASSPFPAGGITITGSALTGATCDNGPCTGTGSTGTYLVSGSAVTVTYNSTGLELSLESVTSFNENHNIYISNLASDYNANGLGPLSAVIGNNHPLSYGSVSISNIFYDPSGGFSCIDPRYNNAPGSVSISNIVNLLGNGSGLWDPNSASRSTCNGLAP